MSTANSNIDNFLESLREKNISLKLNENNNLDVASPAGVLEPGLVESIKSRKEELIDYLSRLHARSDIGRQIPQAVPSASYPLSSAQLRLWLSSNIQDTSAAYHIKSHFELTGPFDPQRFEKAIARVIERHEILRTVFRKDVDGTPRQFILPATEINFRLAYQDISEDVNSRVKAGNYIYEDSLRNFDLEKAPLFRVVVFRLAGDRHLVYYNMHHIITDAWSINILSRDILLAYEKDMNGQQNYFQPLRIQYKDYAAWQQTQLISGALEAHRQYWLEQFRDEVSVLELSISRIRPRILSNKGYALGAFIRKDIALPFKRLCTAASGSLFMGLIASLKALFYHYSGQQDIVLGTPAVGREHSDLQDQIGFYINTLALRTRFSNEDSFAALFDKVRTTTMKAYEHQSYPFDRLIEDLQLKRDPSRSLLFDVFVNFEAASSGTSAAWAGSKDTLLQVDRDEIQDLGKVVSKFDLIFNFHEVDDDIYVAVEFNRDLFDKEQISAMIAHLQTLMASIIADPNAAIKDISYLTSAELDKLMTFSTGSHTPFPEATVIDLFEHKAAVSGHLTALRFNDTTMTYRELDTYTNQLAHYLQRQGVEANTLVPVFMHRSIQLVTAILAIAKAGGAYVPIDPDCPPERITYILSDTNARVLLTDDHVRDRLTPDSGMQLLDLNAAREAIDAMPPTPLRDKPRPGQLAYLLYTSGSTGLPKGVLVEHAALNSYLSWARTAYFNEEDQGGAGLFSSIAFDLTVTAFWGSLISGKTLHIFPQEMPVTDILRFYLDDRSGLDIIKLTPAHLRLIPFLNLKTTGITKIISGGEPLYRDLVEMLLALKNDLVIYNEYGPTEATVGCTLSEIRMSLSGPVDIGKPVPGAEIYILDKALHLVGIGMAGELYIGGRQLAKGYHNQEALTKEKFIDHPFCKGERLYRTGDTARWLPDGNIDYIGRADDQVKIRGYRIEPAEIECSLVSHPHVRDAVVIVRNAPAGGGELVGFVISEANFNVNAVRLYLKNKLPEYMIPNIYIQLSEFPRTVNGKVNKTRLVELADSYIASEEESFELPANEVERQLSEIWKKVLMIHTDISVTANFFELGGHSIRAIKMLTMVSQQFGVSISVRSLFEEPTIRKLAAKIQNADWVKAGQEPVTSTASKEYEKIKI